LRPVSTNNAIARTQAAAVPPTPAMPVAQPAAAPAPAAIPQAAPVAPAAAPIVITDNRSWTFSAGRLEGVEEGLLHFGGGIGLAYLDGVWLTGERADIAFSSGTGDASTITIPDQATLHIGDDTMNITGSCVIQSTNGQITSITADQINVSRAVTNAAPVVSAPQEGPPAEPVADAPAPP
jgi:hypothetical protein